jgi:hypothetical protein
MCTPIFGTGKVVVVVALASRGVYAGALIKKRRYWPKGVLGEAIDEHFRNKEVGDVDMLEAKTEDNKPFRIFCFRNQTT